METEIAQESMGNIDERSIILQDEKFNGYLQGFIEQFGDGPLGEISPEKWTTLDFLLWLEVNGFEIIKK
jgi:hypothetical protein